MQLKRVKLFSINLFLFPYDSSSLCDSAVCVCVHVHVDPRRVPWILGAGVRGVRGHACTGYYSLRVLDMLHALSLCPSYVSMLAKNRYSF